MKHEALECVDVRRSFVAGQVPSGPELERHLAGCPECRELLQDDARLGLSLGGAVPPELDPGELFELVGRDIARERGPRARLRALPTRLRTSVFVGVAALLLLSQLAWHPRANLGAYSPLVFWTAALLLGAAVVVGAVHLLRGPSAPLASEHRERAWAPVLLAVPALVSVLAPLGSAEAAELWGRPGYCFAYGAVLTAPLVLVYWLFERRDTPPSTALLSAGAIAGLAANLLLHAHCPSAHPGHLLLGHVSIGLAWAALLWLLKKPQLAR
jgi:hypothetical protein